MKTWLAISQLKARHLRLLDTKDWSGYAALLTDDHELDISEGTGIPVIRGRDTVVAQVSAQLAGIVTVHQVHLPVMTFDGDEVRATWAMQDRIVRAPDQPSSTGYGYHHDCWVRRDGGWKLRTQKLTRLHVDIHPPQGETAGSLRGAAPRGGAR
jgi:hypothetical protein